VGAGLCGLSLHLLGSAVSEGGVAPLAVVAGGIMAAAIGVVHQSPDRALSLDGHGQRGDRHFQPHGIAHRPTHQLARAQVESGGAVQYDR